MSSRIIRTGHTEEGKPQEVRPIQWRLQGAPPAAPAVRTGPGSGGKPSSQPDSEREKELQAAAYQQGIAAGEAAATQRAQARLEPALAAFQGMVADLAGMRKSLRAESESAAVALALA